MASSISRAAAASTRATLIGIPQGARHGGPQAGVIAQHLGHVQPLGFHRGAPATPGPLQIIGQTLGCNGEFEEVS